MNIRWHGNGFIQVELNSLTRVHIYDTYFTEELGWKRVENARIHDHAFNYESRIVRGTLMHGLYNKYVGYSHDVYEVDKAQEGEPLVLAGQCEVIHQRTNVLRCGDNYEFGGPDNFHDTWTESQATTIITKTQKHDYNPRVICLAGEPDDAFSWQPPAADLRMAAYREFVMLRP